MGGVLEGLKCIPIERVGHSSGLPFKFWKQTAAPHKIYFFRQITTFIKIRMAFYFWASDPLIDKFYKNLSIKGSEAGKQRPHEFL